jgi:glycosyltransferase involved in cell wall biosynthesis
VDADHRIVADTGSTDGTVDMLRRSGVIVHHIAIRPWRFDDARNAALALIPSDVDVCVSMDMDEFLDPGWRPKLEATWTPGTTAVYCQLAARSSLEDSKPRVWPAKKFHSRWNYRFRRPVHEALFFLGEQETAHRCDEILIHHIQDWNKPTRQQYLPLLEVAHKEDPSDSQLAFWLGRDLMYSGRNEQAVEVLQHYLDLPLSTWGEERSEAMRYLARIQPDKKLLWLEKARLEAPHRREIWLDLAEEYHHQADWLTLFWACTNGIEKTYRTGSYLDDPQAWGFRLYDLGAIACWHLDMMDRAVELGRKALELDPDNQRLKYNHDFFTRRRDDVRANG